MRFLPPGFSKDAPIGLIAGQGDYPRLLAQRIRQAGVPLRLLAFEQETPADLLDSFPSEERVVLKVGQIGALLKALKRLKASYAVMAGQITPKRLFDLHPDLKALTLLATLKERNAETIFGAIAKEIEALGVTLLDARVFLEDQLAHNGVMTGSWKQKEPWLRHGIFIAKEVARLGIGQGVVVRKGTVLAVEAFEGTDAMLQRAGTFKTTDALFVKTIKSNQDFRFDVPVFGLKTIETLTTAGIHSVALETDTTLMLNKESVLHEAKRNGISIYGYTT